MDIAEMDTSLTEYLRNWTLLSKERPNQAYFNGLRPTAIGWKTQDLAEFDRMFTELRQQCDQVHLGWVNDRWLASMHLKDARLKGGIEIIKLMQRRPGSTDPVGLDHVDFLCSDSSEAKKVLAQEQGLNWTEETNNPHCSWLSIWFDNTEAKLRDNTVLDVCIAELREINDTLL